MTAWGATVLLLALSLAACTSDKGDSSPARSETTAASKNGLVFTREDSSQIRFPSRTSVWCGPWDTSAPVRTLHVEVGSPRTPGPEPFWELRATVAEVDDGWKSAFPMEIDFENPTGAELSGADADSARFMSTEALESNGEIVFYDVACEPTAVVSFSINGELGDPAEGGSGSVSVRGEFRGRGSTSG